MPATPLDSGKVAALKKSCRTSEGVGKQVSDFGFGKLSERNVEESKSLKK